MTTYEILRGRLKVTAIECCQKSCNPPIEYCGYLVRPLDEQAKILLEIGIKNTERKFR